MTLNSSIVGEPVYNRVNRVWMEHRKSSVRRRKRQPKGKDDANYWDCSVCTYRNTAEAFKCLMCDIRKGTSTRKPKINPNIVATQLPTSSSIGSIASTSSSSSPSPSPSPSLNSSSSTPPSPSPSPSPSLPPQSLSPSLPLTAVPHSANNSSSRTSSPNRTVHNNVPKKQPATATTSTHKKKDVNSTAFNRSANKNSNTNTTATSSKSLNKVTDKVIDKKRKRLKKKQFPPRLKNIDRTSGQTREITVNSVTVVITEYKPKKTNALYNSGDSFSDSSIIAANR